MCDSAGKHILYLDTIADSAKFHRDMAERMFMAPVVSVAPLKTSPQDYAKQYRTMVRPGFLLCGWLFVIIVFYVFCIVFM